MAGLNVARAVEFIPVPFFLQVSTGIDFLTEQLVHVQGTVSVQSITLKDLVTGVFSTQYKNVLSGSTGRNQRIDGFDVRFHSQTIPVNVVSIG